MLKEELQQLKIEADIKKYCSPDFYDKLDVIINKCKEAARQGESSLEFNFNLLSKLNLIDKEISSENGKFVFKKHDENIIKFAQKLRQQGLYNEIKDDEDRSSGCGVIKIKTLQVSWK